MDTHIRKVKKIMKISMAISKTKMISTNFIQDSKTTSKKVQRNIEISEKVNIRIQMISTRQGVQRDLTNNNKRRSKLIINLRSSLGLGIVKMDLVLEVPDSKHHLRVTKGRRQNIRKITKNIKKSTSVSILVKNSHKRATIGMNSRKRDIELRQTKKEGLSEKQSMEHTNQMRTATFIKRTGVICKRISLKVGRRISWDIIHTKSEMQTSSGRKCSLLIQQKKASLTKVSRMQNVYSIKRLMSR